MFIRQNRGKLSKRRRQGEFNQLTDNEVALIEDIVGDAFEGFPFTTVSVTHFCRQADPRK